MSKATEELKLQVASFGAVAIVSKASFEPICPANLFTCSGDPHVGGESITGNGMERAGQTRKAGCL